MSEESSQSIAVSAQNEEWTHVITPKVNWWDLNLKEVWEYRDLIRIFVARDFKAAYKQTILGPLWFIIQPLFATFVSMFIFGQIAQLSADGVPQFLFFFCSISLWTFFSNIITPASRTFTKNAGLFAKIYYPRIITPIAGTLSSTLRLAIPFGLFILIWAYYLLFVNITFKPTLHLLLVPYYILLFVVLANSLGIIISSFTTKYRDLQVFIGFGVQALMYLSAIQYTVAKTPAPFDRYLSYNPLVPIVESYRYAFFGQEDSIHDLSKLAWTSLLILIIALFSLLVFNKVEKNFIDTV